MPERLRLQDDNQQREPHRELRKQVVKGSCESKMQAVNQECAVHNSVILLLRSIIPNQFHRAM